MTRDFGGERKVCREVAYLISKTLPEDDPVLVVTFKTRDQPTTKRKSLDFVGTLRRTLEEAGVNPSRSLQLPDGTTTPKVSFTTWGEETGSNRFKHCRHVVFAGVLHRSELDIAGYMLAQRRDPTAKVPADELREVVLSEVAHGLYQAMSRGRCRMVDGDQALGMDVWLMYADSSIRSHLEPVLPGATWTAWEPAVIQRETKVARNGRAVRDHLRSLPHDVTSVSLKALGQALRSITEESANALGLAVKEALQGTPEWTRRGRTLYRADQHGFVPE